MCVIVTAAAGCMPTISQIAQMSDTNPDGAGIAWWDGAKLHRYRNADNMNVLAFITQHWEFLTHVPYLLHFRLATHGKVCVENTHPFRFATPQRSGFIAHNGIARRYEHGRFASDSRNAVLAWQTGQADLTDGTQGQFALIDDTGRIEWLTGEHETIRGGQGVIAVSNTNWEFNDLLDADAWWEEAYEQGRQDALEEHGLAAEYDDLDHTPHGSRI